MEGEKEEEERAGNNTEIYSHNSRSNERGKERRVSKMERKEEEGKEKWEKRGRGGERKRGL